MVISKEQQARRVRMIKAQTAIVEVMTDDEFNLSLQEWIAVFHNIQGSNVKYLLNRSRLAKLDE